MAGVRQWMSAQPPPSVLKSVKPPKPGHSHRKPDLTTEPERDIDRTSTEGMVRRLLEPSVDRAEEKEYKRCAFHALCNGANSDAVNPIRCRPEPSAPHTPRLAHPRSGFVRSRLIVLPCQPADMRSSLCGRARRPAGAPKPRR